MSFLKANAHYQDLKPLQYDPMKMREILYFKLSNIFKSYDVHGRGQNFQDLLWACSEVPCVNILVGLCQELGIRIEKAK